MQALKISRSGWSFKARVAPLLLVAALLVPKPSAANPADQFKPDPAISAAMKQAIAAYRSGDIASGDKAAVTLDDPFARVTTEWAALRILQEKAGFDRIMSFLIGNPDWPAVTLLRRRGEETLYGTQRDAQTVLDFFKKSEPITPTGRYLLADAMMQTGKTKEANELARKVWREDALPPDIESKLLQNFGKVITQADKRARVDTMLDTENWGSAERNAIREGEPLATYAKVMIGAAKKDIDPKFLMARLPPVFRNDDLPRLFLVQALRRADRLEDAAAFFLALPKTKPLAAPEGWWSERRVLARRLFDDKKHALALAVLSDGYTLPQTAKAEAAFLRGLIELEGFQKPLLAAAEFDLSLKYATTDNSKARAVYWRGLAHQAAAMPSEGDFKQAASLHFGYYGFLARERLGQDQFKLRKSPPADFVKARSSKAFLAVTLLMAAGENESAIALASDAVQQLPDASAIAALSLLGRSYQDGRFLMQIGREALKRGLPFDEEAYPVEGFPEPPQIGVEHALVYGIARQESTFDPRAMSPVGARGLMQLMVTTAKETARRNDMGFDEDRLLDDPFYNVLLGTSHLGELLEAWAGSYVLSIASYNAGSANTRKWVETYGDPRTGEIDPVHFVERIPFSETRNYVQRVLENVQVYRMRLADAPGTQLTLDLVR